MVILKAFRKALQHDEKIVHNRKFVPESPNSGHVFAKAET